MRLDLAHKLRTFVTNGKPYPIISAIVIGVYMLSFYYSKNLELGSSRLSFLVFAAYFLLLPVLVTGAVYHLLLRSRWRRFAAQSVFVLTLGFFGYFLLEHFSVPYSRRISLGLILLLAAISFRFKNHKVLVLVVGFMSLFPLIQIARDIVHHFSNPSGWNRLPDDIEQCRFTQKPNVYLLQMDGYASAQALQNRLYQYDNRAFDTWLHSQGFSLYDDFRSNYNSTLKSNASMFSMMHHYARENVGFTNASDYIMNQNPVLRIFKNNGYRTHFITERPYFLASRPDVAYDYSNFSMAEVPLLKDGWSAYKDITTSVKSKISAHSAGGNFFFVQKFSPGHIAISAGRSKGAAAERLAYIEKLKDANVWLKEIITYIAAKDPRGIVIILADHGGFVGLNHTGEAFAKITDPDLLYSIFGARCAVKWNGDQHTQFDSGLYSSVNLFRTMCAFLSNEKSYLSHLQADVSYNNSDPDNHEIIYPALNRP